MLRDTERTNAFRQAILRNRHVFEGRIVLDVGAGTGVLALFAAQAGAARVFAVERSDMAMVARQVVADSGFAGVVEVIHGLVEEVVLPVPSVDVIVSEWIGTFLIHESMLDSVLYARDKWLAPGGVILPDSARLFIAGADDQGFDFASWDSFHGLNFSALAVASRKVAAQQCLFRNSLVTEPAQLLDLDLYSMSATDQEFSRALELHPIVAGEPRPKLNALAGWFTFSFFSVPRPGCERCTEAQPSTLTTHPNEPCTHWQQTLFALPGPLDLEGMPVVEGKIEVRRSVASQRDLDVRLQLATGPSGGAPVDELFHIVGADL